MNFFDSLGGVSMVLLLIFIVFLGIWAMCGWDDIGCDEFTILDLNMPAPWCMASCGGGGADALEDDEDNLDQPSSTDCPPIDEKMMDRIPILLAQGHIACVNAGGHYYETASLIGCLELPTPAIDCWAAQNDPNDPNYGTFNEWEDACIASGGELYCSPNDLACYCPGTDPFPAHDCGYTYNSASGMSCTGGCDGGEFDDSCNVFYNPLKKRDDCGCVYPCGSQFEDLVPQSCFGVCPEPGQTCNLWANPDLPGAPLPNACSCMNLN